MMIRILVKFIIIGLIIIMATGMVMADNRIPLPEGIYYHRFVSNATGPEATWINPAGLAYNKTISIQMMGEMYEGKLAKSWGINLTGDGMGISYRSLDDALIGSTESGKYTELIVSGGKMLSGTIAGGMYYRYIKDAPDLYDNKSLWGVGFLITPMSQFSYGIVFSNLGKAKFNDDKTDFVHTYGITYNATKHVFLTAEMSLTSGQSLKDAVFNYGIDVCPMEGVNLYGNWWDGGGYEIGVRVNLLQYFVGGQSRHNDNNDNTGTTVYGGYVAGEQDSLIKEKKPQSNFN